MGKASSIVVEANKPKRVVERGTVKNIWVWVNCKYLDQLEYL